MNWPFSFFYQCVPNVFQVSEYFEKSKFECSRFNCTSVGLDPATLIKSVIEYLKKKFNNIINVIYISLKNQKVAYSFRTFSLEKR